VGSLISFATDHRQQFPVLKSQRLSPGRAVDNIDRALHLMLRKTLHLLSDIQLPTNPDALPPPAPFRNLDRCPSPVRLCDHRTAAHHCFTRCLCFAKLMSNTRVVVALLPPYETADQETLYNLTVHFYECSRESVGYGTSLGSRYIQLESCRTLISTTETLR